MLLVLHLKKIPAVKFIFNMILYNISEIDYYYVKFSERIKKLSMQMYEKKGSLILSE